MDELEEALAAAEEDVAAEVRAVLEEVAEEFAAELADATELVAARFSVGRIARMWASRMPRVVARLLGVAETAAHQAADSVDADLDGTWDDLPGRYEGPGALHPPRLPHPARHRRRGVRGRAGRRRAMAARQ